MMKEKFPISISTYTHLEANKLVYNVLKKNPQGLLLEEIKILTGIGTNPPIHKILNRLKNKIYIRNIGARNTKLYYAKINARKIKDI